MNIMKEAHKLTKEIKTEYPSVDYKAQLGICIAYLSENKGEAEMVELKGTEKQIAWAEDIRKNLINSLESVKELKIEHKEFNKRLSKEAERSIEIISKVESASIIIDYRNNLKSIESSLKKLNKEVESFTLTELKKHIWSFTYILAKEIDFYEDIDEEFVDL